MQTLAFVGGHMQTHVDGCTRGPQIDISRYIHMYPHLSTTVPKLCIFKSHSYFRSMRLYYLGFGNEILARRKARVKDVHDLHA